MWKTNDELRITKKTTGYTPVVFIVRIFADILNKTLTAATVTYIIV